jgi:putative ABC transport system ATP-binding protein
MACALPYNHAIILFLRRLLYNQEKVVYPEARDGKMEPYVKLEGVTKVYDTEGVVVNALRDVSFTINKGEICVIVGQSGAGKTTLLNVLGGMDTLTSGKVYLGDAVVSDFNKRQLTRYRREDVGFVFQFYNLIPNLTALENVEMATELSKAPFSAAEILEDVGLGERKSNFPAQLSGGEQQRVAIARALAKNPKLLLCDEPTGALDDSTGKSILKLLQNLSRQKGMTVVIITHNSAITGMADRVVRIKNGMIASVKQNANPKPVEEIEW